MLNNPIIITMGDPSGIGPEIILSSFTKEVINNKPIIVFGDYKVLSYIKKKLKFNSFKLNRVKKITDSIYDNNTLNVLDFDNVDMSKYEFGQLSAMCGNAAFEYVIAAIDSVKAGEGKAIVTAPLNKSALHLAGHNYAGHTEIFATKCDCNDYAMHLYDERLSIIHVSTHVSLNDAVNTLTQKRIERVIELADLNMKKINNKAPRIAVAGLNPHCGENGIFGDDEDKYIIPAVQNLKNKINVVGPIPPDTVFYKGINGEYDIVVAMYHDQGHIPFKMYAFETGVNTSAGLPIVRTSVDHGTAFDIAGKGIAEDISLINSIKLADKLA